MRFFSFLAALLFVVLLAACGGGGGSPGATSGAQTAFFTTAPATLTLQVGSAQEFTLAGGKAPYIAVSNNAAVAVGGVTDTRLSVGGVSPGTANITLRDAAGATSLIAVTVKTQDLTTPATQGVTLAIGAAGAQTYPLGGGAAPFTATSTNVNVATAAIVGGNVAITGVAAGSASIIVRDSFGATINIPVTVASGANLPLFTSAPSSVTISIGSSATYLIGGGSTPYIATSSNTNVATVSLTGTDLTINGVTAGPANILVRDAAGATLNIGVTVGGGTLTVNPSSVSALIGDVILAKVTGGRPPYSAVVTNTAVADATISADGRLQVTVKQQAANVAIVITDADGLSTTFTLTSAQGQPAIQISPTALTISELSTDPVTLQVYGAVSPVSAFSSDTSLLQATANGNTVIVSTGTKGNRCVAADTTVTISAVDAKGALATATVIIKNSVSACP